MVFSLDKFGWKYSLKMILQSIPLILALVYEIQGFKILVMYPTPSLSHQRGIMALTERLVQDGHELFVASPNIIPGLKSENYTYVDASFLYDNFFADEKQDGAVVVLQQQISKWNFISVFQQAALIPKMQFLSKTFLEFQRRVQVEKIKFDVVIIETFHIPFLCAMSRHLAGNAPIISMSTMSIDYYAEDPLGSILHLSFVPGIWGAYTDRMSIWTRMENWLSDLYMKFTFRNMVDVAAREFFRENYGAENLVDGCWNNVGLSLIASNSLYYYPRLLGPNVIELGPMHIKRPEKLSKDLQQWLDGAEKGAIYFSLGSNMKSKSLPEDVRSNFLKFFRELPPGYRMLWKWELEGKIPGQSNNILGQKWLPQESVLAHPKVKVFITQGGLQSFQEAVHYGVPTVGIPWFGDQECNVAKMVDAKIGVRLRPQELHSYENIRTALEAVLYDETYSRNMKKLSAISHDFTSQALDKAVFWVEHVARHGGASHLRPSTADTTYFQFFCLDIISGILAMTLIILYIINCSFIFIAWTLQETKFKIKEN